MRAGLRAWRAHTAARHKSARLRRMTLILRNPAQGKAWVAWQAFAAARRENLRLTRRAALRWTHRDLSAALQARSAPDLPALAPPAAPRDQP